MDQSTGKMRSEINLITYSSQIIENNILFMVKVCGYTFKEAISTNLLIDFGTKQVRRIVMYEEMTKLGVTVHK